jgi:hypothetical protein
MIAIGLLFVRMLCDCFKSRRRLEAEILVLRHQLNVLRQHAPRRLDLRWADRALFIWLYTRGNDVSERVIQKAEMGQGCLVVSKGFDTFNPFGPAIETNLDPANITTLGRVNGVERQSSNTSDLVYSIVKLIGRRGRTARQEALARKAAPSERAAS